jgi:transposase
MQEHLTEIGATVDPGTHAVLILDQAGWHTTTKLIVAKNITLLPPPPRSPEIKPVENIWKYIRDNWLSNSVFKSYDNIVAPCCEARN